MGGGLVVGVGVGVGGWVWVWVVGWGCREHLKVDLRPVKRRERELWALEPQLGLQVSAHLHSRRR